MNKQPENLGEALRPLLVNIEKLTLERLVKGEPMEYSDETFQTVVSIFHVAMLDKMWSLLEFENMEEEDRWKMIVKARMELDTYIRTFTGVDLTKK